MSELLIVSETTPTAQELLKAMVEERDKKPQGVEEPKALIIDPLSYAGIGGVRDKPTVVPYKVLRAMSFVPAIAAVINTRLNQVARFSRTPKFDGDVGFRIGLKDKEKKMSAAQEKRANEIEQFFLSTGFIPNLRRKDNFNQFLRKVVRDTLTIDVLSWENVPNLKKELSEIWAVDGATIEIVANSPVGESLPLPVYEPTTRRGVNSDGDIAYVQRVNGQIVAEFTEDELAYGIRNPRTDIRFTDFGFSELEQLMEVVTGIVNGVRYNTSYFTHSNLPQGVLELVGKYKDSHLEDFKRHWKAMVSGAVGKWSVPVIAMEDGTGVKFTDFKKGNRDMEFNQFMEFLFNIACAVYQIDPNEVGFKSWTSGQGRFRSDNTEAKMDSSQDKGFIPLMHFLSDTFNSEIVDRIEPEFSFNWVGVDEENEDLKLERQSKKLTSGLTTVREVRLNNDEDEILNEDKKPPLWTMAPANPQLLQVFLQELGMKEQQEQQGQETQNAQHTEELEHFKADDEHVKDLEKIKFQADLANGKDPELPPKPEPPPPVETAEKSERDEAFEREAKNEELRDRKVRKTVRKSLDDELEIKLSWEAY